ncbi:uncharacterized protein AMSG_02140 [Thecamonas trahens ATCC 50062]|uniref:WW domain-containing protein n=1 Tax=Thecamonas trahens ATCC 50062 TaxID=461836 RepID=A0A0L0DX74_THETB|nr:hypothetical protein AMSG_02140 [Thecamonas trahens ATCC 50062]KNC56123.1 hypothetical protein AMSG_02140 [Thecamonas trahens ATCC 50062]|eukprot:XP_013761165.1 hypothetical protein AMSG_02140 [Thecamonas trahens ATCC 50062]
MATLPDGWEARFNPETNSTYYVDHNTRTTHWELPGAATVASSASTGSASMRPDGRPSPPDVPPGWEARWDATYARYYFFNLVSLESVWELPLAAALPPGWEERHDPSSGQPYYVDHKSQATHWSMPPEAYAATQSRPQPQNLPAYAGSTYTGAATGAATAHPPAADAAANEEARALIASALGNLREAVERGDSTGAALFVNRIEQELEPLERRDGGQAAYAADIRAQIGELQVRLQEVGYQAEFTRVSNTLQQLVGELEAAVASQAVEDADARAAAARALIDSSRDSLSQSMEGRDLLAAHSSRVDELLSALANVKKLTRYSRIIGDDLAALRAAVNRADEADAARARTHAVDTLQQLRDELGSGQPPPQVTQFYEATEAMLVELDAQLETVVLAAKVLDAAAAVDTTSAALASAATALDEPAFTAAATRLRSQLEAMGRLVADAPPSSSDVLSHVQAVSDGWALLEREEARFAEHMREARMAELRGNVEALQANCNAWASAGDFDFVEPAKRQIVQELVRNYQLFADMDDGQRYIDDLLLWVGRVDAAAAAAKLGVSLPPLNPGAHPSVPSASFPPVTAATAPSTPAASSAPPFASSPAPASGMPSADPGLDAAAAALPPGWEARRDPSSSRLFYVNHRDRTTSWTPPQA